MYKVSTGTTFNEDSAVETWDTLAEAEADATAWLDTVAPVYAAEGFTGDMYAVIRHGKDVVAEFSATVG